MCKFYDKDMKTKYYLVHIKTCKTKNKYIDNLKEEVKKKYQVRKILLNDFSKQQNYDITTRKCNKPTKRKCRR